MVNEIKIHPSSTSMAAGTSSSSLSMTLSSTNALSFLSKGWREVWDSADADLQLMRDRANSVKNLASTFDREIENFLNNSARSAFSVGSPSASSFSSEIGIMKKLQPKISEFRRVYSAPEISRKVMERWGPARAKLGMDLSAIKKAIASEMELDGRQGVLDMRSMGRRHDRERVWFTEFFAEVEREGEANFGDWEPIRSLKTRIKQFEKRSSLEILSGFENSEFVEKLKTSFVSVSPRILSSFRGTYNNFWVDFAIDLVNFLQPAEHLKIQNFLSYCRTRFSCSLLTFISHSSSKLDMTNSSLNGIWQLF